MKLCELLSVVTDNLSNVVINLDNSVMCSDGLTPSDMMTHLEDEVLQVYVYRNKLKIILDNPCAEE